MLFNASNKTPTFAGYLNLCYLDESKYVHIEKSPKCHRPAGTQLDKNQGVIFTS